MNLEFTADTENNFEDKFERHLRAVFYLKPSENSKGDISKVEYFGVFSLKDVQKPERKLWYMYYCRQPDIDKTVDAILEKYGKKNMYEIFRKPIFSGAALREAVKQHFTELKWIARGNMLEAPPKSYLNDDRMIKSLTDLYNIERQKMFNFVATKIKPRSLWK